MDVELRGGEAGEDGQGYRAAQQHREPGEHGELVLLPSDLDRATVGI